MKVLKFGGTSVANAENISKIIDILKVESSKEKIAVVVSALGGVTDMLIQAGELATLKDKQYIDVYKQIKTRHFDTINGLLNASEKDDLTKTIEILLEELKQILKGVFLINEFSEKTRAKIVSFGELLSSTIIAKALQQKIKNADLKDSRELIITDSNHTQATVNIEITNKNIITYFQTNKKQIVILPGFISRDKNGESTTLGRGGSDYTAALIAAALHVNTLEIWTDVSGMYTANPKLVKQAFPIAHISYQEAMELSHFGAKVLYPPTVLPALKKNITIIIKNTFNPNHQGTMITKDKSDKKGIVKGISHIENISLLTLEGNGMLGITGFSHRAIAALSKENINIVLITQASSEHSICIGINSDLDDLAKQTINSEFAYEISLNKIKPLTIENNLAITAVVGDNMKNHQGISGRMFSSLGKNNVNIRAIAQGASERNISAVIAKKDIKKALNTLHSEFFEKQIKKLNIYIVGIGNVGGILLNQIQQQQEYLLQNLLLDIRVAGISNSKKMIFYKEGIDLSNWKTLLEKGENRSHESFLDNVKKHNLRNSIFVDVTANNEVANTYAAYLQESISVVACNKIACSSSFESYQNLKNLSREYNASFLFETNVGAGLPIINTLQNLINCGDKVTSIQAVLSGSLNFIFNNFNEKSSFYDVVKQAQKEGYTEPDPRIDLSGVDVARKILILARESGYTMDLSDIKNDPFLAKGSLETETIEDFFNTLKTNAKHYENIYKNAQKNNCRLKYVADFNNGKATVGLKEIPNDHPFYNLEGKDNIVLFYTNRYKEQPLIIKGAGAGAAVTASGLFADIISLGKN